MSTKNMLKSKKAISPILATLLLIVIAVAAIVVTYAWIMTYMGRATQQASVILYNENVRFYNSTTQIVIGNSGTGDAQIVRLYIGTSANDLTEITTSTDISSGKPLTAHSTATITVTWPISALGGNWTKGETYYFKVVPNPGQAFPFSAQAPQ
jgi:flagellin-like protein